MRALLFLAVAACSSPTDHATHSVELADSWIKDTSNTNETAMTVKFDMDLTFKIVARDGTPYAGTFEIVDPILLLTPTIPANTLWCVPRVNFSGPNLDMADFTTFDPTICGNTKDGAGIMSPLWGLYDVDVAAENP
jgi:hypothetical protein